MRASTATDGSSGKQEELFRQVVEAAPNAMIMINRGGAITLVNRQTELLFGYSRDELLGQKVDMLVPSRIRASHPQLRDGYFTKPSTRAMGVGRDLFGVTKDGREVPIEIGLNPIETDEGAFVLASIIDITERKRADSSVRDSESRFRLMVSSVKDYAMLMLDVDGHVASWNEGAQRLKGFTEEEVLGKHFSIFYPPDDVAAGKPAAELRRAIEQGRFEDEGWRIRKDGSRFWANVIITPMLDGEGGLAGFSKVTRDMTERRRSDERFRLVVEAAPNAMIMVNHEGIITLVNRQTEKLFGYSREELLGQRVELLVPVRTRVNHPGLRNGFFANPTTRSMGAGRDLYGVTKDGREVPIEIGLNPIETAEGTFVLASIIDITERKRLDSRFRLAVEAAPNAMIMINQDGAITLVNRQTELLFGYSRDELLGQKVDMLVPSRIRASHPHLRDGYFTKPSTRAMGVGRDLFGVTKDGREVPIEIGLNPIETDEGAFVLASIIDITERKRGEQALRSLNQSLESQVTETQLALDQLRVAQNQLVQQEKMASLGGLVAGVAHEINTPVGVGVTAASHLQQEVRALSKAVHDNTLSRTRFEQALRTFEQASDIILLNLSRAADLINSFKRVAVDQSSDERRQVKLKSYVEEVLLSLKPKLKTTKHRIELDCPDDIEIVTTPGALSQILTNLVINSVTHAFEPDKPGLMTIRIRRDGEHVELKFSDDGRGIPPEHLSRIFDPFFTTRRGQGGTGLGLHIVFNLVHQTLGGTIQVASEPGRGSTFIIRF
jgi:PAS domain S-box-containing protein